MSYGCRSGSNSGMVRRRGRKFFGVSLLHILTFLGDRGQGS